eukprot:CAMPEP_0116574992 /NCGR_PEP_ID=MMETSP0397-20121206/19707_1 /TAXON_ID=216820 /ORGANISM="Cyclophora tenuis, Strain ECT3854" /LENGTH=401 /DNA_ID=CAMNT_0004103829 /DNA_START=11 /DNA_END=1216 /DNA_ORIENTATION=+
MTTEAVVNEAHKRSKEVVNNYLLNEAQNDHAPHALIVLKKEKKIKKKKKVKKEHALGSSIDHDTKKKKKKHKKKSKEGYKSETSTASESDVEELYGRSGSPVYFLLMELRAIAPEGKVPRSFPALRLTELFDEWTDERKKAYDKDAIKAIRDRDIGQLRSWHQEGRTLQAANSFGESLLHLACRRGFLDVVTFLVTEAKVNLWIRDDTGRTPLHDACWTPKPCYELVDFIINIDRDMLFVSDKRGHTPLDYAKKEHWPDWIKHFKTKDIKTLLPVRPNFFLDIKTVPPKKTEESAILENVDDMICQLEISSPKPKLERRHSAGGMDENMSVQSANRSLKSFRSKGSSQRRSRRRRHVDHDGDSITSGTSSRRTRRPTRPPSAASRNNWKVVDVKVVKQDAH